MRWFGFIIAAVALCGVAFLRVQQRRFEALTKSRGPEPSVHSTVRVVPEGAKLPTDRVPEAWIVRTGTIGKLAIGQSGCAFLGVVASEEGHIWVNPENKLTDDKTCTFGPHSLITRSADGWTVRLNMPFESYLVDAEWKAKGFQMAKRVEVLGKP